MTAQREAAQQALSHTLCRATQTTAAFGALALAEVAAPGLIAQDLAASRDLKSLGHRFFCFDTFRASHKFWFFSKERAV